jgi:hypothetical protein
LRPKAYGPFGPPPSTGQREAFLDRPHSASYDEAPLREVALWV